MTIKYLKNKDIDIEKWDYCVKNSINSMVYGMSWYLDIVCDKWDALIADDYKAVMPLVWKSKFGIKYIYQPFFTQQLGVFFIDNSYNNIDPFIEKIPFCFVKYDMYCNYKNKINKNNVSSRVNYVLDINKDYDEIVASLSTNTKRNIKKGYKNNLIINHNVEVSSFIELSKQNNISNLNSDNFTILERLFNVLIKNRYIKIVGAYYRNNLIAGAAFLEFNNRIIYLFSASSHIGKDKRAMFVIVDTMIRDNVEQNKIIDFEGSMITNISRFFKGFGAVNQPYFRINKSKIPFVK